MKKFLALILGLTLLVPQAFAKHESSDEQVAPVSVYGTYSGNILPLSVGSGGALTISGTGTAGTPDSGVQSVQGVSGMYPVTIGGITNVVAVTPTITAGAYTTGQCLGGLQTIASATRTGVLTGVVTSVLVTDASNQKAPIDVFFFNANPTNSTFTDNAAFTVNAADIGKYAGHVTINASDYAIDSAKAYASVINKNLAFKLSSGTTLYAVAVIRGSATYGTTSAVSFMHKIYQD